MVKEKELAYDLNEYCLINAEKLDVETIKAFQHVSAHLYEVYQQKELLMGGEFIRHDCASLCKGAE